MEEKPNKLLPILLGVVILLLVVVIGIQVYSMMQMQSSGTSTDIDASIDKGTKTDEKKDQTKKELVPIEDIEPVEIVNKKMYILAPDSTGVQYMLRITINLGLDKKSTEYKEKSILIEEKVAIIRGIIDTVIREKTYEDYQSITFWDDLNKKLLQKLNDKFDTDMMVDVYFDDVYIQATP